MTACETSSDCFDLQFCCADNICCDVNPSAAFTLGVGVIIAIVIGILVAIGGCIACCVCCCCRQSGPRYVPAPDVITATTVVQAPPVQMPSYPYSPLPAPQQQPPPYPGVPINKPTM
ncbi:uncharacterized protein LOC143452792 [Clavelina lepadiformis]